MLKKQSSIHIVLAIILQITSVQNAFSQFTLSGSASSLGDSCYLITPNLQGQVGSIWSTDKVSLEYSFEIYAYINFGENEDGADGMTFSLQPVNNTVGNPGQGMGMEGISPSFFVEFDTYQNSNLGDPPYDHINIFRNGVVNHNTINSLVGPDSILSYSDNAKDGEDHLLHITWDASTHTFQVFMDCTLRLTYTGNIVNTIFNGDPNVYWGFTGSTGALTNNQSFCFLYIFFENTGDAEICKGDSVQVFTQPAEYYNWRPYAGLSDIGIQNPKASPDTTTTYVVKYVDLCGNTGWDTLVVKVRVPEVITDSVFICEGDSVWVGGNYIKNAGTFGTDTLKASDDCDSIVYQTYVGVVPFQPEGYDTTFCPPENIVLVVYHDTAATYLWSTGQTGPNVTVSKPGHYYVDIIRDGCTQRSYFNLDVGSNCSKGIKPANIFTPNSDGKNDFFTIENIDRWATRRTVLIYNRWGNKVYESTMYENSNPWDGTDMYTGASLPDGVYFYIIDIENEPTNEREQHKGTVTLSRGN